MASSRFFLHVIHFLSDADTHSINRGYETYNDAAAQLSQMVSVNVILYQRTLQTVLLDPFL